MVTKITAFQPAKLKKQKDTNKICGWNIRLVITRKITQVVTKAKYAVNYFSRRIYNCIVQNV